MSGRLAGSTLRNYRVFSKHPYYQYLAKYEPEFLRQQQTDREQLLGRSSMYWILTRYFSNAHISLEEEHGLEHKTPAWYMNIVYPGIIWTTFIVILVNIFYLGDQGKVFNAKTHELGSKAAQGSELTPTRYESLYIIHRERQW